MANVANEIAARDFGKRVVSKLAKRGISFIGIRALPDVAHPMPYANADRGYVVNDNGTCRVWTHGEVLAVVKGA